MVFQCLFLSGDHPNLFSKMKRKIIVALLFVISILSFSACGKIQDGIVDGKFADYKVVNVSAPSGFTYSNPDSFFTISAKIQNFTSIAKVWASVKTVDGSLYISKEIQLLDNGAISQGDAAAGDGIFSQKVLMSKKYSNGKYIIEFFVQDNINPAELNTSKVGEQSFIYDNKQTNYPPVISNLVMPSAVIRGESFTMTVKVTDQNSLSDVSIVYFKLFRPDGTLVYVNSSQDYFPMFDNGDTASFGDLAADDGIYSLKNSFGATSTAGNWRFEFQAKDRSGALSNVISQTVEVK